MPGRSELILNLLKRNCQTYSDFLRDFELGREDPDFEGLVNRMLNKLKHIREQE